jgi:hypothetical protein
MEDFLFNQHISRLKKDIGKRKPNSPWNQELTKVDLKNIASLHERRVPLYRDHGPALPKIEMFEFSDLK